MQYYPLDPDLNEIRLMTLLPCVEDQSRVRCTFEHTSLINPPEFCALSYCWGDPNITREITINGSSCQITTNLESALYQLGKKGYTRLWVDAICINQDDKVEKSQQLLWMGSIYRRAKEVVAWLGEEDVISAMVMDYIAPLRHSPTVTGPGSNLEIADFISFLERPYWSRVWIIQELALAKHTTIHCGGRQMSWAQFLSAFRSQERDAKQSASRSLKHLAFVNAKNLIKFHQDASKINPVRFIEALERSSEAKSTDPRDKAFALLELVYDSALYIPVPNYRQSAEDICIAITLSVVGTTSNLDIIPLLGCGCDNQDILPSWCPPWLNLFGIDRSRSLRYMEDGYIDSSLEPGLSKSKLWYKAAGNTAIKISMQDRVLKTQGRLVDRVDSLLLLEGSKGATRYGTWFQSVGDSPNLTAHAYGDARGLFRAISETLTRHDTQNNSWWIEDVLFILCSNLVPSRSRKRTTSEVYNFLSIIASLDVVWSIFKNTQRLVPTMWIEWANSQEESRTCPGYHRGPTIHSIERVLQDGQTFMVTSKGYVGWAHPLALPGDHIYILSGCTIPIVLRSRKEGGFVLVGDAYVQGIMEGEAVKGVSETDWTELDIY